MHGPEMHRCTIFTLVNIGSVYTNTPGTEDARQVRITSQICMNRVCIHTDKLELDELSHDVNVVTILASWANRKTKVGKCMYFGQTQKLETACV